MSFTADGETAWCLQYPREHNNWPLCSLIVYSQQSLLKEKSHHVFKVLFKSLEGLMLKLKYFSLILGKMVGRRRRGWQRMKWMASLTQWTRVWVNSHSWWLTSWCAAVHGVTKSRTQPSDFTFTFHFHALEKEMATHSSVLVWRIPGTGEPGGLPSMGSHRVGHDWSNLAAAAYYYLE